MAQLDQAFDSGQHDDMQSGFDPLPKDDYLAKIVESDVKVTAKKDGKYIKLKFKILQGEFKGRFVWTNINIVNPNPVAVEIAQKELATLCRACGKGAIQDTQELHETPFMMKLKITPAKGDYPAGNSPIGYYAAGKAGVSTPPKKETGSESTEPTPDGDAPWGDD